MESVLVWINFMHNDASMARCDVTKKHSDVNYVWTQNDTHQLPLYQIAILERCANLIVGAKSQSEQFKCCREHEQASTHHFFASNS